MRQASSVLLATLLFLASEIAEPNGLGQTKVRDTKRNFSQLRLKLGNMRSRWKNRVNRVNTTFRRIKSNKTISAVWRRLTSRRRRPTRDQALSDLNEWLASQAGGKARRSRTPRRRRKTHSQLLKDLDEWLASPAGKAFRPSRTPRNRRQTRSQLLKDLDEWLASQAAGN